MASIRTVVLSDSLFSRCFSQRSSYIPVRLYNRGCWHHLMEGTERYWGVLGVSIVLAAGALMLTRPLLAVGAVSLWVWLIGAQIGFAHRVQTLSETLQLSHELSTPTIAAGRTVDVTLSATLTTPTKETITVQGHPPVSATGSVTADRTLTLTPGDASREQRYTITLPATGPTTLRGVTCSVSDRMGLFTQTLHRRPNGQTQIEVSPYGPDQLQIGRGTQSIGRGYGDHEATHGGGGIDPQELREYIPGDSVADIDWNATARLPDTYVREYEAAMTQQTLVVLDTRPEMRQGPPERTMLGHARRIGHSIVRTTQLQSDPLGWLAVDGSSAATFVQPQSTPTQYRRAKQFFDTVGVTPTRMEGTGSDTSPVLQRAGSASGGSHRGVATTQTQQYQPPAQTLADRHQIASRLATTDSVFATQLQPFFTATGGYMEAIDTDSLFHSLRVGLRRIPGTVWTVIISSDNRRTELFETVRMASQGDSHVAVFLTPSVLFSETIETNPEEAYEQYQSFEQFRERLDRHAGVSAFEVGPQDRIAEVLDSRATTPAGPQS